MCTKITRLVVLVGELLKYLRLPSRHSGDPTPPPMGHALCLVITSRLMEKDYGVRQGTGGWSCKCTATK